MERDTVLPVLEIGRTSSVPPNDNLISVHSVRLPIPDYYPEVANVTRLLEARGLSIDAIAEHAGLRPGALRDFRNPEHLGESPDQTDAGFTGHDSCPETPTAD